MEARRTRNTRGRNNSLLPLRRSSSTPRRLSNTISCWYCDYKISAFNEPMLRFGRRFNTALRIWFSIGVGFSLTALVVVILFLVWELATALRLLPGNPVFEHFSGALLFGFFNPSGYGLSLSLADAAYLLFSTIISVSVHEFGHAVAAASEGLQMEYIAMFLAVLFPGALVAFNYELLQLLPRLNALRIYCAGIWHNAVFCAVCGMALFLLPFLLFPFYIYGESPMVLDAPSTSPLFGYLSPGDVIVSIDGKHIHNAQEWMEMAALIDKQRFQSLNNSKYVKDFGIVDGRTGYCVPNSMIKGKQRLHLTDNPSACPNDLTAFVSIHGFDLSTLDDFSEDGHLNGSQTGLCLNARDIVKCNKCSAEWATTSNSDGSNFTCPQEDTCLSPVQLPDSAWVEITYLSSQSPGCLKYGQNPYLDSNTLDFIRQDCSGSFVFIGDVVSMAHSIQLTAYQPRWAFPLDAYIPNVVERSLTYMFHVSLTLALLNSLPVYFLDGESILEIALCLFTSIGQRKREKDSEAYSCPGMGPWPVTGTGIIQLEL
ncbi:membrane-bound transcription factor site-2 protease isoform X1 [Tripterygium wilfordii]|uniref:Endopeptidase S2P n=1 Tax=Tripterygium wilfordii TaxID=458696 RepID=A0A7J7D7U9_TRIWF|nr:membrane-bound transcription factor site-2 protease isoform X1 [Tripterygium wilfordii]